MQLSADRAHNDMRTVISGFTRIWPWQIGGRNSALHSRGICCPIPERLLAAQDRFQFRSKSPAANEKQYSSDVATYRQTPVALHGVI
jgi:hypothetical protein